MDMDTFITTLYVMVDDFCKVNSKEHTRPGPRASLSRSEVVTLAIVGQWWVFGSERGFYRWAKRHLISAFPSMPDRSQFNRLTRQCCDTIVGFFLALSALLGAANKAYEVLDTFGIASRNLKRRGSGWFDGQADIGWCGRLGWYEGFRVLDAVSPDGIITGYAFGSATAREQTMSDTFFALRNQPHPMLPSAGKRAPGVYVADTGFEGRQAHKRWQLNYGVEVISPRKSDCKDAWPIALKRWLSGLRQIVETVHDKLINVFRLGRERPHDLTGLQVRMAAKVALHNFCVYLNRQLGRPQLAFVDLVQW